MSRAILFAMVVALVVCYANCVPAGDNTRCPPNKVWEKCLSFCDRKCPEVLDDITDPCFLFNCNGECVCKEGFSLNKAGACVPDAQCETH